MDPLREILIDVQDFLHSIYMNGGRSDLADEEARKRMRDSAEKGITLIDNTLDGIDDGMYGRD